MINSDILDHAALLAGSYPQRFGDRRGARLDFVMRDGSRDRTTVRGAVSGTNASMVRRATGEVVGYLRALFPIVPSAGLLIEF
jgi:hypothetical protein